MLFENFYKLVSDLKYYSKFKSFAKTVSSQIKFNLHFFLHLLYREYVFSVKIPQVHHHTNILQRNFLLSTFALPPFSYSVFAFKTGPSKVKGDTAPLCSWHDSSKADPYTHHETPLAVHSPQQSQSSFFSRISFMLF